MYNFLLKQNHRQPVTQTFGPSQGSLVRSNLVPIATKHLDNYTDTPPTHSRNSVKP